MKKNILKLQIIAIIILIFTSCENNFNPHILGSLTTLDYPTTESEYESYAMTCYTPFTTTWVYNIGSGGNQHGFYIPEGGVLRMFEATSDDMAPWTTGWGTQWLQLSLANFNDCVYYWRGGVGADNPNHFQKLAEITRFTQIIGTIQKAPSSILTDTKKNQLLGETRLCRGLMMYYMLHIYGPLPVILNPDDVNNEGALENMQRPSLDSMSIWIERDFEFAINNLPKTTSEQGRYTSDYARVCMMRHCLNEGSHMTGYYAKAIQMYQNLKGSGYGLYTTGVTPFADLFKNANKFNKEIIMAVSCSSTADGSTKSGNFNPLMMLAVPADASKLTAQGTQTPFYLQGGGWGQCYNVSPKFYDTYENGDKRKDVVLASYRSTKGYTVDKTKLGVLWNGYIINKFPIETATPFQGTDIPLARWADVLLMYAEAEVRNTGSAPSQEAIDAVNQVRHRAGLSDLSSTITGLQSSFLDAILIERGHEFLYEGLRKIDLIRFNRYAQNTYASKGVLPSHQYMPLPNYAVQQASSYGKSLQQTYERSGWATDVALAK